MPVPPWHLYVVGDMLEIVDPQHGRLNAQVCGVEGSRIFIHYEGWSNQVRDMKMR